MRLLRGLGSQLLPCGCLAGIYETYAGTTVGIIDARGEFCTMATHRPGEQIEERLAQSFSDRPPMTRAGGAGAGAGPAVSGGPRLMR
jgi:hypothetical protein